MPKLFVFRGRSKEAEHELGDADVLIGRSPEADVFLDNPVASRRHARVRYLPDQGWLVENAGAGNGLFVNGGRVESKLLNIGDSLEIGHHVLIFHDGEAGAIQEIETRGGPPPKSSGALIGEESTAVVNPKKLMAMQSRARARMNAHFVLEVDGRRSEIPLTERHYNVGFSEDCGIRLPGSVLFGKRVAELRGSPDGGWTLHALSALAPVRVNGTKISRQTLEDGDRVTVKGCELRFFGELLE